jgi:hypothetical protein
MEQETKDEIQLCCNVPEKSSKVVGLQAVSIYICKPIPPALLFLARTPQPTVTLKVKKIPPSRPLKNAILAFKTNLTKSAILENRSNYLSN